MQKRLKCPECGSGLCGKYMLAAYADYMAISTEEDLKGTKYETIEFANLDHPLDADISETDLVGVFCRNCGWSLGDHLGMKGISHAEVKGYFKVPSIIGVWVCRWEGCGSYHFTYDQLKSPAQCNECGSPMEFFSKDSAVCKDLEGYLQAHTSAAMVAGK